MYFVVTQACAVNRGDTLGKCLREYTRDMHKVKFLLPKYDTMRVILHLLYKYREKLNYPQQCDRYKRAIKHIFFKYVRVELLKKI